MLAAAIRKRKLLAWVLAVTAVLAILNAPFVNTKAAPSPTLVPLQYNLPSPETLDIIFLPQYYTQEELANFSQTVENYSAALFTVAPFSEYKNSINIWRVDTTEDFGASRSPTMERLLTVNNAKVKQYVGALGNFDLASSAPNDVVIVLVNTQIYGGSGASDVAVTYVGEEWGREVMMHELGHSFGGLGEEYVLYDSDYPAGGNISYPNVDWDGSKWAGVPGTGAFQGAWYRNLVRPTNNSCLMATSYWGYCPVCERALRVRLEGFGAGEYCLKVGEVSGNGVVLVNGTVYNQQNWTFLPGDTANVTAVPADGWSFVTWSSFGGATDNPSYLTMYENKTVNPIFKLATNPTPTPTHNPTQTTSPKTTPTANTPEPATSSPNPSASATPTPSVPEIGGCITVLALIFGALTAILLIFKRASPAPYRS
ncbi:MAG: M64 family metallo-endopeptidase [Candidatus Bathyarchaeota archaeon]|nr:M64 family metallo-endopeptidase [Candidatus Bathyarchaeota archaeon]